MSQFHKRTGVNNNNNNNNPLRCAPSSLQEETHLFLEGRKILDIVVNQQLRNLAQLSVGGPVWVAKREGRTPPGFLIIRPDSPSIYWNCKTGTAHILRIFHDRRQLEKVGGLVFSVTYSDRKLIIEDVLYYNSTLLWYDKTFTQRWEIMKTICKNILRPDVSGILGFTVEIVALQSISEFLRDQNPTDSCWGLEFYMDAPKSRRLFWSEVQQVPHSQIQPQQMPQPQMPQPQMPQPQIQSKQIQQQKTQNTNTNELICSIEKDPLLDLPDSYLLFADEHKLIGAAAIRKLATSQAVRIAIAKNDPHTLVRVVVQFNEVFKKYEVLRVVDNDMAPLSQLSAYDKRTLTPDSPPKSSFSTPLQKDGVPDALLQ